MFGALFGRSGNDFDTQTFQAAKRRLNISVIYPQRWNEKEAKEKIAGSEHACVSVRLRADKRPVVVVVALSCHVSRGGCCVFPLSRSGSLSFSCLLFVTKIFSLVFRAAVVPVVNGAVDIFTGKSERRVRNNAGRTWADPTRQGWASFSSS